MNMKIFYIVNARIPTERAHGNQITQMCQEFARQGAEVELWVPARSNPIRKNPFLYHGVEENFKIKRISFPDFYQYGKYLKKFSYYFQTYLFPLRLIFISPDKKGIVYTRNPEIAWIFSLRGYKVAYECHDWFGREEKLAVYFLRKVDLILPTNNFIANEFLKRGFSRDRVKVVPNGVSLEVFDIRTTREEAIKILKLEERLKMTLEDKKILLYTGTFRTKGTEKGIRDILKAMSLIKNNYLIFLAVGGNDEDRTYYEQESEKLNLKPQTFFFGRATQAELAFYQKAADILLMPFPNFEQYRYFMTPLKMFEYMAAGRPIIASDLPSIREILNEEDCLFFNAGEADDLVEKICLILEDEKLRRQLGQNANKNVRNYTWRKRAKEIITKLRDC